MPPRRSPSPPAAPTPRVDGAEIAAQLEEVRAEHEEAAHAIRAELAATVERLERDRDRERSAARAELTAALERVEQVQRGAEALRERLTDAATTDQLAELRQSVGTDLAALRDSLVAADVDALARLDGRQEPSRAMAAAAPREAATAEIAALREAVARQDAATGELTRCARTSARPRPTSPRCARRSPSRGAPTREVATLREAVARHEAATGELAALRAAVTRRGAPAAERRRAARGGRAPGGRRG